MGRNNLYPIFLKTNNLNTLIVGGGNVGLEKLTFLLKSSPDAKVTVLSKEFLPDLVSLAKDFDVQLIKDTYQQKFLEKQNIVIAATDDVAVNEQIYRDCRERSILVNVADNPPFCDFYMGGIVTKENLKIAISTNGKSPTTAKRLRQFFEEFLPENMNDLLENLHAYRKTLGGDFAEKVDRLNELTKGLIGKNEISAEFKKAISLIDIVNQKDPTIEEVNGRFYPKEFLYSLRMTEVLDRFTPNASESLQLAIRAQHIGRWEIPRKSYEMNREGYLKWRKELKDFHAKKAQEILEQAGYQNDLIEKVKSLIKKKQLKRNKEAQILEDVACLVFLEDYFSDFAKKHSEEKVMTILQKTWAKMSDKARAEALKIKLTKEETNLIKKALQAKA
jgi:precorrin-2 dehydrogenase/sirohydrochlorin ferrochelatase